MTRQNRRGNATIEFTFIAVVLVPLLLGTGVVGINLLRTISVTQVARDAGHMFARGLDFSRPGNQSALERIGRPIGLDTNASASNALVVLSALTYVDTQACQSLGLVDSGGIPTSACTNYQKWVFTQRLAIGNTALYSSVFGSPITTGTNAVTVNGATGKISPSDYVTKSGAVAVFHGINPYHVVSGSVTGLPSGQMLYLAEAGTPGLAMKPFVGSAAMYAYGLF
jgi:hypothetical protein